MRPRVTALLAALALAGTACVAPGASTEDEAPAGLQQPTFTPLATNPDVVAAPTSGASEGEAEDPGRHEPVHTPAAMAGSPSATSTPVTANSSPSPEPTRAPVPTSTLSPSPDATTAPPVPRTRGTLTDGTGDLRGLAADRAPAHADLRQLTLEIGDGRGEVRIAFAGPAPETGDGDTVLNVATYHDVTGDGQIDYEIWASLTADGWGTSWFDIREGTARFAAEDDVEVEVADGVLVLTFPSSHLDGARAGRWLASSEWGTTVDMSAGTTATDDAPDDRTGRAWPS